jgi:hypothetical protein
MVQFHRPAPKTSSKIEVFIFNKESKCCLIYKNYYNKKIF